MILTVTLNAAIDRTYRIDGFALDRVNRPQESWIVAGGKGINVARVVSRLGGHVVATGLLGGHNGEFIAGSLKAEGIRGEFVRMAGESRTCIAAVDHMRRTQTEINEIGPDVGESELQLFQERFDALLDELRPAYVTFSGSVPRGVNDHIYRDLIATASAHGAQSVLDASGEPLREGVGAKPWMVKPNAVELEHLTGCSVRSIAEAAAQASEIQASGIAVVAATLGANGCVLITKNDRFWARSPEVPFVSAVGSGDAFVGAFLASMEEGTTVQDACRRGVAAGAANACRYGAGFIDRYDVDRLAAQVVIAPV